ncbi:hypothetical protein ACI2LO_09440 [Streptomyces sp. NPDC033754]|uniref:hypothetical protein n=1 Tax=unclassified Streptomyces TaxID=2593676 RepID=UPI0033C59944
MHTKAVRRRTFAWTAMAFAVAFYASGLLVALGDEHGGFGVGLVLATMALFLWAIGWDSTYRYTATHVSTTHFLVTTTVAWRDVAHVDSAAGLALQLRDGTPLGSVAYGDSLLGAFTGYVTHRGAQRILDDAHHATTRPTGRRPSGPVPRHHGFAWRRGPAAAAVIYSPILAIEALKTLPLP